MKSQCAVHTYTTIQKFGVSKILILSFSKDAFNYLKVTAKAITMVLNISISNKCCSLNFLFVIKESWKN